MSVSKSRPQTWTCIVAVLCALAAVPALAQPSFDELVDCRWAVEEVLWRHRIWPEQNPGPKPPLAEVLSRDAVERRVDDALRQTAALEERFHSKLDAAILQHELDRMAKNSKDPAMLRELFAAAGSGERAALCLALPSIARTRLDAFYATDPELHRALREEAELGLARATDLEDLAHYGAEVEVTTVERARDASDAERGLGDQGELLLDDDAWNEQVASLARSFDAQPRPEPRLGPAVAIERASQLPVGRRSTLEETRELFRVRELREASDDRLVLATAVWRKRPMDAWWADERDAFRRAEPEVHSLALPEVTGTDCVDDTWSPTRIDAPPSKRYYHVAVWTGTEMIVWSGSIETVKYNDGRLYFPSTDSWDTLEEAGLPYGTPPGPRHTATAVWTGTFMIIYGGYNTGYLGDGGRYSPTDRAWANFNPTGSPGPRTWHTAVWTGTEMIVWGGYDSLYRGDGASYSPADNTWSSLQGTAPAARAYHSAVWAGDRMIVWGGRDLAGPRDDGAAYFPFPGSGWVPLESADAPTARYDHTAVWTGSEMIVWGGYDGVVRATGGRYTPGVGWSATPTSATGAPSPRRYHRAVWSGAPVNRMIVWGGYDGAGIGDGNLYDPATNGWSPMSSSGAPEPRWGHSLVWTGSEAIVWGGGSSLDFYQSGGRYDPLADSWTPTSLGATPSGRELFTSVWTGSEVIVWGGVREGDYLRSGGSYDPAQDLWVTIAENQALAGVASPKSVWTGNEVLVWGGSYPHQQNGGRYFPGDDHWEEIPTTGAPTGRVHHSMVWTGSEAIVWGGLNDSGTLVDGGRYAPGGGWAPLPAAPISFAARSLHSAIWANGEMIVWGGVDPFVPEVFATGARYSPPPGGDSWSLTEVSGAPAARYHHAGIWTGSEMIVWGGADTNGALGGGGRYDPGLDGWSPIPEGPPGGARTAVWTGSRLIVWGDYDGLGGRYETGAGWEPTSLSGAPDGRVSHAAQWTGTSMIVWGGKGAGGPFNYLNSGGRYCSLPALVFADDFESGGLTAWSGHP